jgi:hypothetical protein
VSGQCRAGRPRRRPPRARRRRLISARASLEPALTPCPQPSLARHSAIATTLFSASLLGSLTYTLYNGRSAFTDARNLSTHLLTGNPEACDDLPGKAHHYAVRFR